MKPIVEEVKESLESQVVAMAGLTDKALKGVVFYIQELLKFKKFRLEIHFPPKDPAIIIHLMDQDGTELFVKHKKPEDLDNLAKFLGIPNYKISLAVKSEE